MKISRLSVGLLGVLFALAQPANAEDKKITTVKSDMQKKAQETNAAIQQNIAGRTVPNPPKQKIVAGANKRK